MKQIETHPYFETMHKLTFSFKELVDAFFNGIVIKAKVEKQVPLKEWHNGDKVIVVNNNEKNIWTGEIVDEDYMIHNTRMPVFKDDKTGELLQCGGVFLPNDKEGIMLKALLKLDWNERWNLVSKGRAGIYDKNHYKVLDESAKS